jgi:hypothetical protein
MGIKSVADLVPLNPTQISPLGPTRKAYHLVPFQVLRTNTTATKVAVLPADATILGFRFYIQTASSGTNTSASVTLTGQGVGPNGATFAFGSQNVFTGAPSTGIMAATVNTVTGIFNLERPPAVQTSGDIIIYATYAEAGGTSTTGGPFYFVIEYVR